MRVAALDFKKYSGYHSSARLTFLRAGTWVSGEFSHADDRKADQFT
jgi:hypothetical protein